MRPAMVCLIAGLLGREVAVAQQPTVVVAVFALQPDYVLRKNAVIKFSTTAYPLPDFDFESVAAKKLVSVLSEDKRLSWRAAAETDQIKVQPLLDGKAKLPDRKSVV